MNTEAQNDVEVQFCFCPHDYPGQIPVRMSRVVSRRSAKLRMARLFVFLCAHALVGPGVTPTSGHLIDTGLTSREPASMSYLRPVGIWMVLFHSQSQRGMITGEIEQFPMSGTSMFQFTGSPSP